MQTMAPTSKPVKQLGNLLFGKHLTEDRYSAYLDICIQAVQSYIQ